MAESYIFFKQGLDNALNKYKSIYDTVLNYDNIIKPLEDDIFQCNNMQFYELSSKWCVGDNVEGNTYAIERLLALAGNTELIYLYFDEAMLEGELIVIREGQVVRKLFDYDSTPELNENTGKLEYEETNELKNWVDIASFAEYLFEYL